jgi:protein-disulfide isomerase
MTRTSVLSSLGTATLVLCAILVTGTAVHREFGSSSSNGDAVKHRPVAEWSTVLTGAIEVPVIPLYPSIETRRDTAIVVEFADFQCPYCARTRDEVARVLESSRRPIRFYFAHYPLTAIHPHAFRAAVAADCADDQQRGAAMIAALYAGQARIGVTSWSEFASLAGVRDSALFASCVTKEVDARVDESVRIGRSLELEGTPTFAINGIVYGNIHTPPALQVKLAALK